MHVAKLALGCLVLCLLYGVYAVAFEGPFTFDDEPHILENEPIRLQQLHLAGLHRAVWYSPALNRPVANLSFAMNYYLHWYHPTGYRVVNLLIHFTTAVLLYLFIRSSLALSGRVPDTATATGIAFGAALLWAIHPIQTESVTYIVQRMNSLASLFYILALLCYVRARLQPSRRRAWLLFTVCGLAGLLALGSKEIAITLPGFLVLYEWYFFQDLQPRWLKRHGLLLAGAGVLMSGTALLYMRSHPGDFLAAAYHSLDFTMSERLLTEFRVVLFYLRLLLFPHPSQLNLDHDFALSHSLLDPPGTLLALGAILGGLGLALVTARRARLLSFCLLWFLGNLLLESSVLGLELVFEHRLYLPSMLLSLLAVLGIYRLLPLAWPRRVLLSLLVAVCALWTYERNQVWANEVTLWQDCVHKSPRKARAHTNLGVALVRQGNVSAAIAHFTEALRLRPTYAEAHSKLGAALLAQGQGSAAIPSLTTALRLHPGNAEAHNNLGVALARQGQASEAIPHFVEALRLQPGHAAAHNNLGAELARQGHLREAIQHFVEAIRFQPTYAEAYMNLGLAFTSQKNVAEGIVAYRAALHYKPGWPEVERHLAQLLLTQPAPSAPDITEAVQFAEQACRTTQYRNAPMLETLSGAYAAAGRWPEAVRTARAALQQAEAAQQKTLATRLRAWLARHALEAPESSDSPEASSQPDQESARGE
ncbi:MAG: tetratricopeptide repeat protein [Candidatus Tectimicrobiota bacterium]